MPQLSHPIFMQLPAQSDTTTHFRRALLLLVILIQPTFCSSQYEKYTTTRQSTPLTALHLSLLLG